jgi:hypothetical protein
VPLVLAIEPDLRQAAIVKRIVREKVLADVAVVDSRDAALEAMRATVPDVLLISALLSPRDEDELIAHLRTLDHAGHLQTHTIPQLASALRPGEAHASGGLLSAFRRKKKDPLAAPSGCDPEVFAEEVRSYLQRAAEKKRELLDGVAHGDTRDHAWRAAQPRTGSTVTEPEPAVEPEAPSSSSWASPFEWKPSHPESLIVNRESPSAHRESPRDEALTLMAHLRPPSGVTTLKALRDSLAAEEPVVLAAPIAVRSPEPTPMLEALPIQEAVLIQEDVPIQNPAPILSTGSRIPDEGSRIKDSRLGIRDERSGIRDSRLGALASWARAERPGPGTAADIDDLRALLTGLAVPPAVVAVGYGRGCRIRRVRVPPAREPMDPAAAGPVILSKKMLAEQREQSSRF